MKVLQNIKVGKKKLGRIILIAVLIICISIGIFSAIISYKISLVPSMTFDEMIAYTTKNNEQAIITVGIINDGNMTYTVYGNNASILPSEEYTYEIGSLTKTFTTSLLCKAINEGKADLNDQINKYIELPTKEYYPTLKRLVTHTSGYKAHYFEGQMISNFLHGQKNDFYGINSDMLIKKLGKIELENKEYSFKYSNFSFATIGSVLSGIYDTNYNQLINDFIANDLKLKNTIISDGTGDLNKYWSWKSNDAYLSAGAITSTISDMMQYIKLHMSDSNSYLSQGHEITTRVNATTSQFEKMSIRIDAVGIGWMIDTENNIIWHNGGTSDFNSYAAFDKTRQIGVVILSNCSPNYRIPSTVMGVKLMRLLQNKTNN